MVTHNFDIFVVILYMFKILTDNALSLNAFSWGYGRDFALKRSVFDLNFGEFSFS